MTRSFNPGEVLLMYTDGLVERRGEDIDASLARLARTQLSVTEDLETLLDALVSQLVTEEPEDDIAVLAARTHPGSRTERPTPAVRLLSQSFLYVRQPTHPRQRPTDQMTGTSERYRHTPRASGGETDTGTATWQKSGWAADGPDAAPNSPRRTARTRTCWPTRAAARG
ncbi:SpoIIE family protein phosphatase [Streptacidiphilus sp. PB12-B1b]|uniref:SpoIIE family protein phosphatase n=1 Tax=Streptacidiphilus sp. PB12-B1b TaxID=2705012 RepID=UPI002105BC8D|nr:SpoIIE family protein phosphatase [Streptacidiphilus sp. PB12-B1b]